LKKVLSTILSVLIISQTMVNVGIGIYYHLNKSYITQQLCVNKNNPSLHCNGHCYLAKQLKKAEEQESKQSSRFVKEKDEIVSNQVQKSSLAYFPVFTSFNLIPFNSSIYISDFTQSLIKPPLA
jgi:hypothetical protein